MRHLALPTTLSTLLLSCCALFGETEQHYAREASAHTEFVFHLPGLSMGEVKFVQALDCASKISLENPDQRIGVRVEYGEGEVEQEVNHNRWRYLEFQQEGRGHPDLAWEDGTATEWYALLDERLGKTFKDLATHQFHQALGFETPVDGRFVTRDLLELFAELIDDGVRADQVEALMNKLSIETEKHDAKRSVHLHLSGPSRDGSLNFSTLMKLLWVLDYSTASLLRDLVDAMPHRDDGMDSEFSFTLYSTVNDSDVSEGQLSSSLDFDLFNSSPENTWVRGRVERRYSTASAE